VSVASVAAHDVHQVGTKASDSCQVVPRQSVKFTAELRGCARVSCKHQQTALYYVTSSYTYQPRPSLSALKMFQFHDGWLEFDGTYNTIQVI